MKKMAVVAFMLCCLCSFAQKDVKGDLKTVSNIMSAQSLAWNNGDLRGFMSFYWNSDSLKFIGSKGITYGWQKTLDNYIKGYPDKAAMGILKFTILSSEQLSKTSIYIIGKWELDKEKPVGGHFTLLWKKIDNKWVIIADHTS
ncbi:MAG: nuclear transport factor 2 family protein [Bacteroidetes bacterium]|nr:nuclear transport factor 2 family protein [Bacteroidota bacterium]